MVLEHEYTSELPPGLAEIQIARLQPPEFLGLQSVHYVLSWVCGAHI